MHVPTGFFSELGPNSRWVTQPWPTGKTTLSKLLLIVSTDVQTILWNPEIWPSISTARISSIGNGRHPDKDLREKYYYSIFYVGKAAYARKQVPRQ